MFYFYLCIHEEGLQLKWAEVLRIRIMQALCMPAAKSARSSKS